MSHLPVLELGGDPRERGQQHGSSMREAIARNIDAYLARFQSGGASRAKVLEESEGWHAFICSDNPEYGEEMNAIARASGYSQTEIAMLNARYEITYRVFSSEALKANGVPPQEGCTSFGLFPEVTRSGHTILGQNWDWLQSVKGQTLIQRVRRAERPEDGKPSFVGFSEAGIVGCKMGVNAAGIGLCVNGLVTPEDGANGMRKPFHVRCREVLDAWTYDKALKPVVETDRTCSTNFLIGQADGEIMDIEATPSRCAYLYPQDGIVAHGNHLVREDRVSSEMERLGPHTLFRGHRLDRLLRRHAGEIDLEVICEALSDHFSAPNAICRHPDPALAEPARVITVAAIVLDLDQRILYASDGQPCCAPLQPYSLHGDERASDAA
ncbi:C45 family peptidase [Afifella sp. IM 167]|uniref:C45 family autoproteolytic acyltransferase/hydolase n=1 Tax=Afifella sp. IM 167 TaxID=2033586 RepID=UPI001CC9E8FD|nr:C45 family peptidase [Afifella sp. IM 167]MBZ8134453.1 hypothetical protein [Afifella sp. IM 167]